MGLCGGGVVAQRGVGVGVGVWGGVTVDHPPRTLRRIRTSASRGPRRTARGPRAHHAHHLPCVCRLAAPLPPFSSRLCAPCIQPHVSVAKRTGLGGLWGWELGLGIGCERFMRTRCSSHENMKGRAGANLHKKRETARPAVAVKCDAPRTRISQNSHTETDADRTMFPPSCLKCAKMVRASPAPIYYWTCGHF